MSFGKKYFSSYKSNNGLDYYLELFVANFSGTATEIVLGKGGPVITYETDQEDRFSPILSSQCELPFLVQNTLHQDFIEELRTTFQERQIYLHLYRASSSTYSTTKPLWSGFMVMDLGAGEDVSFPYEQKLTFVDGLALLKDIDFVDLSNEDFEDRVMGNYAQENMYFGPAVYTFWIKEILLKAGCATTSQGSTQDYGFTTAINWYNGAMPNTNQNFDPFGNTKCVVSMFHTKNDQQVFTPENCYTVLKELLRHWGARITYWKHEFWIVQIPEYIQDETGFIDNPDNINTRQYNKSGTLLSSQDHLGDTFFTRYEQTVGPNQISKLVGTKYNYLPITHRASADFLSFASRNYYGGFPFGNNATSQEIFQGTIIDPSSANFLFLSIPLNWVWDLSSSNIVEHTGGWWCSIKFNFYATDGTTEYYLQYEQTTGTYYWVLKADWSPIVKSPKYVIKSRRNVETNYIGFQEQIPFVDASGNAITMDGAWSFFLDIEDYATQNGGSFFCRFSGYNNFNGTVVQRNPQISILLPDPSGSGTTSSGTVSWSNTLQDPSQILVPSTNVPVTFNAGTAQPDIQLLTSSAFMGFLQTLNTTQNASYGNQVVTTINNSNNTEIHDFGTLIWGDAVLQATIGALRVNNGSTFVKTNPAGEWGRGTLSGTKTFTELLIDEFLTGQVKVVISPTMRLVVSEALKNQTSTASGGGTAERPRYVNPIGRLRETRSNETDPEYIFRRGSFFTLQDEWDYEGYQIIRDTVTATTTTNDLGGLGGSQTDAPLANARMQGPVTNALMQNAPVAYLRKTVASTGSNVSVNGNFNTATGWTLGTGWSIDTTISKAKFTATGSTSDLVQDVLELEKTYKISFRVEVTAGTLTVKAGTSGGTEVVTTSGDYIIYKQCLGNTQIKFQAGTTFTGTVTFVRIEEQKSLSQVPIEPLDSAVFKSGDTFNLINSNSGEILELNVTSNQSAGDTNINVTSTALFDDINIGSIVLINQDDLAAQYQNKTKGTVGGFDITATSIDSGSVAISSYIDDDTFGTASATSLATSESIKAYVDGQVGASDTLAEVLANGNTSGSNDIIMNNNQEYKGTHTNGATYGLLTLTSGNQIKLGGYEYTTASVIIGGGDNARFNIGSTEKMRLTSTGLGIGTTSPDSLLEISSSSTSDFLKLTSAGGGATPIKLVFEKAVGQEGIIEYNRNGDLEIYNTDNDGGVMIDGSASAGADLYVANSGNVGIGTSSPAYKLDLVGGNMQISDGGATWFGSDSTGGFVRTFNGNTFRFLDSGGGETMRINNSTNVVLIGTTSDDGYKLNVNGIIRTTSSFVGENVIIEKVTAFNSNGIQFRNNAGAEKMRITDGGNVGIGTSSPAYNLDTTGNIRATGYVYADDSLVTNTIVSAGSQDLSIIKSGAYSTTFSTNGSERARITSGGNLLIGTTTDGSKRLDVVGAGPSTTFRLSNSTSDNTIKYGAILGRHYSNSEEDVAGMLITSSSNATRQSVIIGGGISGVNSANIVAFYTGADYTTLVGTERMRVTNSGNILIGTTSDDGSSKLQVAGDVRFYGDTSGKFLEWDASDNRLEFKDEVKAIFGTNNDASIQFDANENFKLQTTTGDIIIQNTANDKDIEFRSDDGSGGTTAYITIDGSATNMKVAKDMRFNDNVDAEFGTSGDFKIYHDGSNTYLEQINAGTGNIVISNANDDADIIFKSDDGSGGVETYFFLDGSRASASALFTVFPDNSYIALGNAIDFKLHHNGNSSTIENEVGDLNIINDANDGDIKFFCDDGSGGVTAYMTILGSNTDSQLNYVQFPDNIAATFGDGNDLRIYHFNGEEFIDNSTGDLNFRQIGVGDIIFQNLSDDKDIIFQSDDGSGGIADYIRLDGSEVKTIVSKTMEFQDNVKLAIGNSEDLVIDHNATNSRITNYTGNLRIINNSDNSDITFESDNGSGGVTAYITLDGSQSSINLQQSVLIGTTTNSGVYKLDVFGKARVQSVLELDDVLTLNAISTPADPANNKSSIYMDSSDGAIKVKINVEGTVVTRTIASFE